jgi:hypothetical protein
VSIKRIQTSLIHQPLCSQEIIDNENPDFSPFFPLPGLKKILLVGKFIHPLTSLIKPSPLGDKIGQKLVDLHKGTI